jgi:hypothetical protein
MRWSMVLFCCAEVAKEALERSVTLMKGDRRFTLDFNFILPECNREEDNIRTVG